MYTFRTIYKDNYYDEEMKALLRYNKEYVQTVILKKKITEEFKHDLFKAYVDDIHYDIAYKAFNQLDAKIMYFCSSLRYILFQKRIIRKTIKFFEEETKKKMVTGRSGCGMTRDIVKPNILQAEGSLERFLEAQEETYADALAEIQSGYKRTHWMWFIFPQIAGLGKSSRSKLYAISSKEEAIRYLQHPILGARLVEVSEAILALSTEVSPEFLGWPDTLKLRSCMTLFAEAWPEYEVFQKVLDKFYDGERDPETICILEAQEG